MKQNVRKLEVSVDDASYVYLSQCHENLFCISLDFHFIFNFLLFNLEFLFKISVVVAEVHDQVDELFIFGVIVQFYNVWMVKQSVGDAFSLCLGQLKVAK